MDLPPFELFEQAKTWPTLIYKDRVWPLLKATTPRTTRDLSCIVLGTVMTAQRSEVLPKYENAYLAQHARTLQDRINDMIIEARTADQKLTELELQAVKAETTPDYAAFKFVIEDVYAWLVNAGKVVKAGAKKLDLIKAPLPTTTGQDYIAMLLAKKDASLTKRVLNTSDALLIDGSSYLLLRESGGDRITIGEDSAKLEYQSSLTRLDQKFRAQIEQEIKGLVHADYGDTRTKNIVSSTKERILQAILSGSARSGDLGIVKEGSRYFATLHVPEYALKGYDHLLYRMGSCDVGVELILSPNGSVVTDWKHPVVMHPYTHPFINKSGEPQQPICVSRDWIGWRTMLIAESKLAWGDNISNQVYLALDRARNVLESGYNGKRGTFTPYHHLDPTNFPGAALTGLLPLRIRVTNGVA